jgi:hypothetical protein
MHGVPAGVGDPAEVLLALQHRRGEHVVVVVLVEELLDGVAPQQGEGLLHALVVLVLPL